MPNGDNVYGTYVLGGGGSGGVLTAPVTARSGIVVHGSGNNYGYYSGSGGYLPGIAPAIVPGFVDSGTDGLMRVGPRQRLTLDQYQRVMRHEFISMENGPFCLFCYTLEVYRVEQEHEFVIHEE